MDLVCVDTSVFINAIHTDEHGALASRKFLLQIKSGRLRGVISTITVAELLNGAYRLGSQATSRMKRDLEAYKLSGSAIVPLTEEIADKIGELCAKHNARIRPDVIIVATAILSSSTVIVTRDIEHFSKFMREITVLEPEDVIRKIGHSQETD